MSASLPWWIGLSEHLPEAVLLAWFFAAGACTGSMLNVIIYRMPRGMNLWWPRSHCPSCRQAILVRDNIPICSWLRLRGRCRWCGEPIPWRYPMVELACAVLFLAVALAEVHYRGWNLPLPARLAWQRAWYGFPWHPAALALVHAGVLCGLLAAAAIATDRFPVPWLLQAVLFLLAAAAAWLFPRPEEMPWGGMFPRQEEAIFAQPLSWWSIAVAVAAGGIVAGAAVWFMRFLPAVCAFSREACAGDDAGSSPPPERPGPVGAQNNGWLLLVPAILFGLPGLLVGMAAASLGAVAAWALGRRNVPAWWCWGLWIGSLAVLFTWGGWWPHWVGLSRGGRLALTLGGLGWGALGMVLAVARAPQPPPPKQSPLEEKETGDDAIPPEPGPDS